eukprot:scaffold447_cov112-Skeletonema_dohrnii-CCMP3373.AAC.7
MDGFIGLVLPRTRHAIATTFDVFLNGTASKQLSATFSRRFEVSSRLFWAATAVGVDRHRNEITDTTAMMQSL